MNIPILEKPPNESLKYFLYRYSKYRDIDLSLAYDTAMKAIKYYKGDKSMRTKLVRGQELEQQWYQNHYDYSVYDDDYYMLDLWACWIVYSRGYLRSICSPRSLPEYGGIHFHLGDIKGILDLGCGFGYTTAALKQMFPTVQITGTNLKNTVQYDFASDLGKEYNFIVVGDTTQVEQPINLVFASEYFEHILEPVNHLRDIIKRLSPRAWLIANAFRARSIGHFDFYKTDTGMVDNKSISKIFNNELKRYGYKKIETKLWNNRPAYWVKSPAPSP